MAVVLLANIFFGGGEMSEFGGGKCPAGKWLTIIFSSSCDDGPHCKRLSKKEPGWSFAKKILQECSRRRIWIICKKKTVFANRPLYKSRPWEMIKIICRIVVKIEYLKWIVRIVIKMTIVQKTRRWSGSVICKKIFQTRHSFLIWTSPARMMNKIIFENML